MCTTSCFSVRGGNGNVSQRKERKKSVETFLSFLSFILVPLVFHVDDDDDEVVLLPLNDIAAPLKHSLHF